MYPVHQQPSNDQPSQSLGASACERAADDTRRSHAFVVRTTVTFLAVLAFTGAQLSDIGLTWDEPFYFQKQYRLDRWYRQIFGLPAERTRALRADELQAAWNFCRGVPHENPPVYAILSHLTWRATAWIWGDLRGHRLAPAILFSLVAAMGFALAREHWGRVAAWTFLGAWVVNPRIFAHARLATTDMTMTAFWFLAALAFYRACHRGRGAWHFGPLWALSFMSKATGVLALLPQAAFSVAYRKRFALRILCWTMLLAPLVAYLVHPGWWRDPVGGVRDAVTVHRHRHEIQSVKTYYLGEVYPHGLPWHNTLVLTAACMPAAWLLLALVGLASAAFGGVKAPIVGWAVLNFATLMIVRATSIAPGHDGIRQFLAASPYFALLAGYGMHCVTLWLLPIPATSVGGIASGEVLHADPGRTASVGSIDRMVGGRRVVVGVVFVAAFVSAGLGWLRIRPYELSFYSELIGGLRGAQRLGLETAYYWEAAGAKTRDFLNRQMPAGARIGVPYELHIFDQYQQWGWLRSDLVFLQEGKHPGQRPDYYFILAREGLLTPRSKELLAGPAVFEVRRHGVRLLALVKA